MSSSCLIVSCIPIRRWRSNLIRCLFKEAVLPSMVRFKPKTDQYLKQPMTLCREKTLRNWKVIANLTKVFQFTSWQLSCGHDENVLTWERWGFVASKTFHGMMDDKGWDKILRVHPLGKSHIEITFEKHILTRQALVFFQFRYYMCRNADQLLRKVFPSVLISPHQMHRFVSYPKEIHCIIYNEKASPSNFANIDQQINDGWSEDHMDNVHVWVWVWTCTNHAVEREILNPFLVWA